MQVSVETLDGLECRMTVSIPTEKIEQEVALRLKDLARKVKVDGFRPGKVPLNVVKRKYSDSVLNEVAREMVQPTLLEALKENDLVPAGYPDVEPQQLELGKDFTYEARFEVFPEININPLNKAEVEQVQSSVKDEDVDMMIEELREQHKIWEPVKRAAKDGDKVIIDFEGFLGDEPLEGGSASDHELLLGSKTMIEGFESGLIGKKPDSEFELDLKFPEGYHKDDLSGADVKFKVKLKEVLESKLPELDDKFLENFNKKEAGLEAFRAEIRENMERELQRQVKNMNREAVFNKFLECNSFDIPNSLVDREIEQMQNETLHRVFGDQMKENMANLPKLPRTLFEEKAKHRVHLGLLFSEFVKENNLAAEEERVNAIVDDMAQSYEDPNEWKTWLRSDKERLGNVEALALEELVAEKLLEDSTVVTKSCSYEEVVRPEKDAKTEEK